MAEQNIREAQRREEAGAVNEDQLRAEFDCLHQTIKDSIRLEVIYQAIADPTDLYDYMTKTVFPDDPVYRGYGDTTMKAMLDYEAIEDKGLNRIVRTFLETDHEYSQSVCIRAVGILFLERLAHHVEPSEEDMYEYWKEHYND